MHGVPRREKASLPKAFSNSEELYSKRKAHPCNVAGQWLGHTVPGGETLPGRAAGSGFSEVGALEPRPEGQEPASEAIPARGWQDHARR